MKASPAAYRYIYQAGHHPRPRLIPISAAPWRPREPTDTGILVATIASILTAAILAVPCIVFLLIWHGGRRALQALQELDP